MSERNDYVSVAEGMLARFWEIMDTPRDESARPYMQKLVFRWDSAYEYLDQAMVYLASAESQSRATTEEANSFMKENHALKAKLAALQTEIDDAREALRKDRGLA